MRRPRSVRWGSGDAVDSEPEEPNEWQRVMGELLKALEAELAEEEKHE